MISITSSSPVSVTKNGVTQVYSTWMLKSTTIPKVTINKTTGIPSLSISFSLWGTTPDSKPIELHGSTVTLEVDNMLTDATLAGPTAAFFAAIASKAVSSGTVS